MTVAFTGHRNLPPYSENHIKQKLFAAVEQAILNGADLFLSGGARGFDTIAGFTVLALKMKYPHIQLHLILPCENQDAKWDFEDSFRYKTLVCYADEYSYLAEKYHPSCMRERNAYLVEHCDTLIAYMTDDRTGTGQTMHMAQRAKKAVINLAESPKSPAIP